MKYSLCDLSLSDTIAKVKATLERDEYIAQNDTKRGRKRLGHIATNRAVLHWLQELQDANAHVLGCVSCAEVGDGCEHYQERWANVG